MPIYMILSELYDGDDCPQDAVMYVDTVPPTEKDWVRVVSEGLLTTLLTLVTIEGGVVVSQASYRIISHDERAKAIAKAYPGLKLTDTIKLVIEEAAPINTIVSTETVAITSVVINKEIEMKAIGYPNQPTIRIYMSDYDGFKWSVYQGMLSNGENPRAELVSFIESKMAEGYGLYISAGRGLIPAKVEEAIEGYNRTGSIYLWLATDESIAWQNMVDAGDAQFTLEVTGAELAVNPISNALPWIDRA